jgi:Protein of unknown function (DUF3151)
MGHRRCLHPVAAWAADGCHNAAMPTSPLPMHGADETHLPEQPAEAADRLAAALDADHPSDAVRAVVADHPTLLDGWARLAEFSLDDGDPVAAYAFARTGYHRGLDAIRRAGWRGQGAVPWSHPANRGFLRSVNALRRAAKAIGETDEEERCRTFLLELDPDDAQGVGAS